jgi:hypothetical protein
MRWVTLEVTFKATVCSVPERMAFTVSPRVVKIAVSGVRILAADSVSLDRGGLEERPLSCPLVFGAKGDPMETAYSGTV